MDNNFHEYHLTNYHRYRHDQLMEEARRERLKALVMARAHQQQRVVHLYHAAFHAMRLFRTLITNIHEAVSKRSSDPTPCQEQSSLG